MIDKQIRVAMIVKDNFEQSEMEQTRDSVQNREQEIAKLIEAVQTKEKLLAERATEIEVLRKSIGKDAEVGRKKMVELEGKIAAIKVDRDKIAAGFTNSASQSGDKLNTLQTLAVFAAQHGMIWVGLDILPGNNNSKGSVEDLNRLGSYLGAMAQSKADQGPEQGPIASDLKTAEHLGARVASITARFRTSGMNPAPMP